MTQVGTRRIRTIIVVRVFRPRHRLQKCLRVAIVLRTRVNSREGVHVAEVVSYHRDHSEVLEESLQRVVERVRKLRWVICSPLRRY